MSAPTAATGSPTASPLARALEQQRARAGRMLARVRLVGVSAILASQTTRDRAAGRHTFRALDPMSIRGKTEPVALFAPERRPAPQGQRGGRSSVPVNAMRAGPRSRTPL